MPHLAWVVIAASGLLFGQTQNFGNAPDPEEKKRAEKMLSQSETGIALSEKMLALNETMVDLNKSIKSLSEKMVNQQQIAISIAALALVASIISLIVVFLRH